MIYSPFIRRKTTLLKENGYSIHEDGDKITKQIGNYEVLIFDLSKQTILKIMDVIMLVILVKRVDNEDVICAKQITSNWFFPSINKLNRIINRIIRNIDKEESK